MGRTDAGVSPQKTPTSPPRLIDQIGPPTPAQARRLLAILGLLGELPPRAAAAAPTATAPPKAA